MFAWPGPRQRAREMATEIIIVVDDYNFFDAAAGHVDTF